MNLTLQPPGDWGFAVDFLGLELAAYVCCTFVGRLIHPYCLTRPSLARPLRHLLPWKEGIEIEYLQSKMIEFYL
jgi:hypothetical protein